MSKLYTLQQEWKNFFRAKETAEAGLDTEFKKRQAELDEAQKELSRERTQAFKDFREHWAQEKERVREERNEEIVARLLAGESQAKLMKEAGTSNTVLFSELAQVARERQNAAAHEIDEAWALPKMPKRAEEWQEHPTVPGWFLSADGTRFKMLDPEFDTAEDGGEPEFFVGNIEGGFVSGSAALYMRTSPIYIVQRLSVLQSLLGATSDQSA